MTHLLFFIIGAGFSALGAIPPGMINLAVAERSITKGLKSGLIVSVGAGLTEFIYTFIAIFFIDNLLKNSIFNGLIQWVMLGVFLGFGIFYLLKKTVVVQNTPKTSNRMNFGFGILIAGMNMLIIPTWLFLGVWMRSNGYDFQNLLDIFMIALGSATGATFVFGGYARMGRFIVGRLDKFTRFTSRFVGFVFLILAAVQMIRIYYQR